MSTDSRHSNRDLSLRRIQAGAAMSLACAAIMLWAAGGENWRGLATADVGVLDAPTGALGPILGCAGLALLNMLFTSCETAIELLRPVHVRHIKEKNPKRGERLQSLIDRRIGYVAACRLGSYTCMLGLVAMAFLLAPSALSLFDVKPTGIGSILLAALVLMVPIGIVNLMLELVAKSYATLHPHGVGGTLYGFIVGSSTVFWIPEKVVTGIAGIATARFGGRPSFIVENQAEEEIKTLVESAEETGEIESDERELLHSVFEFTDTVAREVMTPRVDMDAMPVTSDPHAVAELIKESGRSRIPVYEDTDDQIVGIVHAKDLFVALLSGTTPDLRVLMRQPLFVPENKNLHELLAEMRMSRSQMAIVQDEFGGTAGIVTIEDIVEELVGDIVDEYDVEEPDVTTIEGGWLVEGKANLDDVNAEIGSKFESDEFDTIGGFVFGHFGRQPNPDESIEIEGYRVCVAETDGRRIARLKIEPLEEPDELPVLEEEQV
ncbi:MAG: hemolysin family protein [Fimbriimonadales bacterium]